jgi:hypothetical protein
MSARLLVVGLGNLTHPLTRHRPVSFPEHARFVLFIFWYSVGQLALDSLSTRLGVTLSPDKLKGGYFAETQIDINGKLLDIALYKTRTFFCLAV